jgi:RNA polymerase sigma-B factor
MTIHKQEEVFVQFQALVEKEARKYFASGVPLEDLIQEGSLGLLHATENYNPDKGIKFITYATHCVRGKLRHYIRDRSQIIKEPAWLQEHTYKVKKASNYLTHKLGRSPTVQEVSDHSTLPECAIGNVEATRKVFSVGVIEDNSVVDYSSFEDAVDDRIVLQEAITKLTLLEQRIIQYFYYDGHSQTEIAKLIGISNNYVSHILKQSARKLRELVIME